jgi:tripartite-type tricarboxylate transporter receptor subunit TctC
MRKLRFVALLLGFAALAAPAFAQEKYPTRPIKFVVGFLAGGPNDIVARIMCDWLTPHLGQPCIVENRVGQGGMIATQQVINSPPDGYTILFTGPNHAIGATLYKNLQFVFTRDAQPLAGMMKLTNVMVVPPSLPVKTVNDFIVHAKANPGKLTYASSGNGTSVHMSAELFKMMAKLDMVHVPYKGSAGIYPDLMTGKVDVLFDNLPGSMQFIKSGKLRALAVTAATRSDALPEVPVVADTLPGYEASVFYGIVGPKGIPPHIIEIINKAFTAAISDPKIKQRIAELGGVPMPMIPPAFGKLVVEETEKWGKVVKAANISVD